MILPNWNFLPRSLAELALVKLKLATYLTLDDEMG